MMEQAVADLGLARFVRLEQRIATSDSDGLRARWEFGHGLLAARDGKGRLPNGYLLAVARETGASRPELTARARFAERFPTQDDFANAVSTFRSWHGIVNEALRPEQSQIPPTVVAPPGTYATIVADPPWQYDNKVTRGAAEDHYPTMSVDDLCALPVKDWVANQGHLYLWTTNGFLRQAFDILDAWGFVYKTTLVWVKPQIGMGNYFRSSAEYVLFGVRGRLRTLDRNQRNWFKAPRGKHSQKPGMFFDVVHKASPPPYLEMFARDRRLDPGWDYWGNEA